jgi:hypothetical protein
MYSETIAGVAILRAFGASSKFLRDMLRCVDTVRYLRWYSSVAHALIELQPLLLALGSEPVAFGIPTPLSYRIEIDAALDPFQHSF